MSVDLTTFPKPMVDEVTRVRRLVRPVLEGYLAGGFGGLAQVPVPFWGGLVCNETGPWIVHNLIVPPRHEPGVERRLQDVLNGEKAMAYGCTRHLLEHALQSETLRDIASSHGLTQVMGYHAVLRDRPIAELNDPAQHFYIAGRVMIDFLRQFKLDPQKDFADMAHCWNAGSPHGATYDPKYESNLMLHKKVWELLDEADSGK